MENRQKVLIRIVNGKPGLVFTCKACGETSAIQLAEIPKGSIIVCRCGEKFTVPFNENEIIAQLRKEAENAVKHGLKKIPGARIKG